MPLDTLLQSLLKDLQQNSEVDRLGPLKEEKADSVAGAIQSDPAEGSQESHGRGAEGQPREQTDAPETMLQGDLPYSLDPLQLGVHRKGKSYTEGLEEEGAWRRSETMPCRGE